MPGQPALATTASGESHTRGGDRADATAWGPGERSLWCASLSRSLRKPGWQGHGCPSEPPVRPQGPRLLPSPPVPAQLQFLSGLSHALYTKPSVGISELRVFLTSTPRSNTQTAERTGSGPLCKAPSPALPWGLLSAPGAVLAHTYARTSAHLVRAQPASRALRAKPRLGLQHCQAEV